MSSPAISATDIARGIAEFIERSSGPLVKPGHRVPFHWPHHPISADYHVLASDWTGTDSFEAHGEAFEVEIARTPHGVFGRCAALRAEARGDSVPEMLDNLARESEPLFSHQFAISNCLGLDKRYTGTIRELDPLSLLKLLYCDDRDIANTARIEIETHASTRLFGDALLLIVRDNSHPNRRIAQWCVFDLFEDLSSFYETKAEQDEAVDAVGDFIYNAADDYARASFKAGVVLGGHICSDTAFAQLVRCLASPNKVARRSAIHGLFHLAEWRSDLAPRIVEQLEQASDREDIAELKTFAKSMAKDIVAGELDHMTEPIFDDEA